MRNAQAVNESEKIRPDVPLLDGMPRDEDGPVFSSPWEAKIFALVYGLCEQGRYEWKDFQNHLIAEIAAGDARAQEAGEKPPAYYDSFLAAGISLLAELNLVDPREIDALTAALCH